MNTAFVKIWGVLAGAVAWDDRTGMATFEYDSGFKNKNWDLAPLKMSIRSAKSIFNFPELKPERNSKWSCCQQYESGGDAVLYRNKRNGRHGI